MSSGKRKSTVHDFSSLRLHPDGTRVGTSRINQSIRNSKYAVQDHRGNWIARDAGGLGRVQKRWSTKVGEDPATEGDGIVDDGVVTPPQSDQGKGKARETSFEAVTRANNDEVKDPRALRRRLFADDLSFIRPPPLTTAEDTRSPVVRDSALGSPDTSLYPSSDLLKCIHYFASTYYSEMGQLQDSTREYRQEKKRRRVERLKAEETSPRASTSRQSSLDASPSQTSNREFNEPVEHQEGASQEEVASGKNTKQQRPRNIKQHDSTSPSTDMYKLFDGSALMAIGMLLQEYVAEQVSGQLPEGWEEEMLRAQGLDPRGIAIVKREGRRGRKRKRGLSEEEALSTEHEEDDDDDDAPMSILSDGNETHGESLPE